MLLWMKSVGQRLKRELQDRPALSLFTRACSTHALMQGQAFFEAGVEREHFELLQRAIDQLWEGMDKQLRLTRKKLEALEDEDRQPPLLYSGAWASIRTSIDCAIVVACSSMVPHDAAEVAASEAFYSVAARDAWPGHDHASQEAERKSDACQRELQFQLDILDRMERGKDVTRILCESWPASG